MGKRDRLTDVLDKQRRQDKKLRKERLKHKRLEQRATLLRDGAAETLPKLKEEQRVLQQLAKQKKPGGGKGDRGGKDVKWVKGKKVEASALDELQQKRLAELDEKIKLLEAPDDA